MKIGLCRTPSAHLTQQLDHKLALEVIDPFLASGGEQQLDQQVHIPFEATCDSRDIETGQPCLTSHVTAPADMLHIVLNDQLHVEGQGRNQLAGSREG